MSFNGYYHFKSFDPPSFQQLERFRLLRTEDERKQALVRLLHEFKSVRVTMLFYTFQRKLSTQCFGPKR